MENNILEYFPQHEGYRCGYCKSEDTNFSHGMWAHQLRSEEYESLLDRGWRRSGKYLYKPTNDKTCCPCYTISCHALEFRISKSQKKVMKKFNDFLLTGSINHHPAEKSENNAKDVTEVINYQEGTAADVNILEKTQATPSSDVTPSNSKSDNTPKVSSPSQSPTLGSPKRRKSESVILPETSTSESNASHSHSEVRKNKGQKAKFLRLERRKQKLLSKGLSLEEVLNKVKKTPPKIKEIEEFLQIPSNTKLKLEIRTIKTDTEEFEATFDMEHSLYKKYHMRIHNDEEDELTPKKFRRFLIDNPLNEATEDSSTGCYHQQYFLGSQLIAVGVVDILPHCLSSVYFFYDPDYMNLTLGTYGALRELGFVRQRAKTDPNFKFYYMGFYIHSCTKMRYKGNFNPSYLLCPQTYQWKLLDDELRGKLDKQKYTPFFSKSHKNEHENIAKASFLYRRSIMPYGIYQFKRSRDDTEEIQEYCDLVGSDIANKLCLYRSP